MNNYKEVLFFCLLLKHNESKIQLNENSIFFAGGLRF